MCVDLEFTFAGPGNVHVGDGCVRGNVQVAGPADVCAETRSTESQASDLAGT